MNKKKDNDENTKMIPEQDAPAEPLPGQETLDLAAAYGGKMLSCSITNTCNTLLMVAIGNSSNELAPGATREITCRAGELIKIAG